LASFVNNYAKITIFLLTYLAFLIIYLITFFGVECALSILRPLKILALY